MCDNQVKWLTIKNRNSGYLIFKNENNFDKNGFILFYKLILEVLATIVWYLNQKLCFRK